MSDFKKFMEAMRGIPAWHVAAALSNKTPGINWRGCSKSHMATEYAASRMPGRSRGYMGLQHIDLEKLAAAAREWGAR